MSKKNEPRKYYQPEFDDNANVIGHPEAQVFSFMVWRKKKNLLADYPNCKPLEYKYGAIEEPTFMD